MESKFKEKDLVWAKMRGYPPWPAKVERKPRGYKAPNNKFYVMFFGLPHKHAWMAGADLFAYEEFIEKYNVPRKGLPEAVSEAEEYRAKIRAHKGNKPVASPTQTGVSPDSNTRKRTPASSERGGTKRIKQEMAGREEEEESRDSDKQGAHKQCGGTPVKLEPGAEPHEDNEKSCPPEVRAPPPKRSGRLQKRLSGKKEATNGKKPSTEAAGSGNVVEGEESPVGKKDESTSVPLVQICDLSSNPTPSFIDLSSNPTPSFIAMDNLNSLQDTVHAITAPLQGPVNDKTAKSMLQSVASSPTSCLTKTEKRRASTRRKTQSPATAALAHTVSTSSPASEVLSDTLLLPPTAKKQCVEEGEEGGGGGVGGRAPKLSPERRSTRPRRTPRKIAVEGEEAQEQRDSDGKADVMGTTNAGACSDGVLPQEKRRSTPLLAPPPERCSKISPVERGRRGRGRGKGSLDKELQTGNSAEELSLTSPGKGIHFEGLRPRESQEAVSGDQTIFEELLETASCSMPPSGGNLPNLEVCPGSAPETLDQPTAATMRIEERLEGSHSVASQRDQPHEDQYPPYPATTVKELLDEPSMSTLECQQEENTLQKEGKNHLHKQPVENLSSVQSSMKPLPTEPPTGAGVDFLTDQGVDEPSKKQSTGEVFSADQSLEKHSMQLIEELSIPLVEQTPTELALDNPSTRPMEEPLTQPMDDPLTKLALDNPSTQPMEQTTTNLALDKSSTQSMEEPLTQPMDDPLTKLALDNPSTLPMEQTSTNLALDNPSTQPVEQTSTNLALDNLSTQPVEQISIKQALEKPSAQSSEVPLADDKPTQPVEDTSTKQALVDSVKQAFEVSPVEHSMENSSPHQRKTLSTGYPLEGHSASPKEPLLKRSSQKPLSGRQFSESPSQRQMGGAIEGESVDVPSQKPSRRRSQKEIPKRLSVRRTSKSQFQDEPLVGQPGVVVAPKPSQNIGALKCLPNSSDSGVKLEPQSGNGGGDGSVVMVIPPARQLVHSQCQIGITPPAYTVEQMESGCVVTIDTHLLGDKDGTTVKDTTPSGEDNQIQGLEVKDCAVVSDQSTGAAGPSTSAGEQERVAPQLALDSTPMVVCAGDAAAPGSDPSVAACETGGGEEEKKKKKRHKQKGSVAMCEVHCPSLSQVAIQPGWTSVQCLQVCNYNLKAALVIGSPDIKTALAVMRSIRSLRCTAEDLQKVPDLVATVRKVRRYRDSDKIRNKANEVYSELRHLFTQVDGASQGGSNPGCSDGAKATPLDQDRPILWEVIDTNDPAAVKSIKMELEGKPPSPSPRRSQRSSVKNNRIDYSKLLEEDGLDEADDQLVPMS